MLQLWIYFEGCKFDSYAFTIVGFHLTSTFQRQELLHYCLIGNLPFLHINFSPYLKYRRKNPIEKLKSCAFLAFFCQLIMSDITLGSVSVYVRSLRASIAKGKGYSRIIWEIDETVSNNKLFDFHWYFNAAFIYYCFNMELIRIKYVSLPNKCSRKWYVSKTYHPGVLIQIGREPLRNKRIFT